MSFIPLNQTDIYWSIAHYHCYKDQLNMNVSLSELRIYAGDRTVYKEKSILIGAVIEYKECVQQREESDVTGLFVNYSEGISFNIHSERWS